MKHLVNICKSINYIPFLVFFVFLLTSCNDDSPEVTSPEPIVLKKDKPRSKSDTSERSAPIINISDTIALPFKLISVKDSAKNTIRLSEKLAVIYGEQLAACIKKNKLKMISAPMAWYKTQKAPFFFEAGVAVDKLPQKLGKGIKSRQVGKTKVIIAHFYGPYEETVQAYQALKDWLKDNKKRASSPAYEIYVTDPIDKDGKLKDPYKVQTDIVMPYE